MPKRRRRRRINLDGVSKSDFVAIAKILCSTGAPQETNKRLASYFGSQNPRFNEDRFLAATKVCGR